MNISKDKNTLVFDNGSVKWVFPSDVVILIANDDSASVNVRLKASRKNIVTFSYDEANISASSAVELVNKIINL